MAELQEHAITKYGNAMSKDQLCTFVESHAAALAYRKLTKSYAYYTLNAEPLASLSLFVMLASAIVKQLPSPLGAPLALSTGKQDNKVDRNFRIYLTPRAESYWIKRNYPSIVIARTKRHPVNGHTYDMLSEVVTSKSAPRLFMVDVDLKFPSDVNTAAARKVYLAHKRKAVLWATRLTMQLMALCFKRSSNSIRQNSVRAMLYQNIYVPRNKFGFHVYFPK